MKQLAFTLILTLTRISNDIILSFILYFLQRLFYCWARLRADGHDPFIGSAVTGPVNDANPTGDSESTSLTFSVYCNCCGK